jgi:hypothetical protein
MSTEPINLPNIITLRAEAAGAKPKGVDQEKRQMLGVVVAQAMKIKDYRGSEWGLELDEAFLKDLVSFAKKQPKGVMSNFGHNYSNLGRRLGRMSNFSLEGDTIYADINIPTYVDSTPGLADLGKHVLLQAEEDPGAIMFSIKFSYKYMFQRDSSGAEIKTLYYDRKRDVGVYPNPELGAVYFKFASLSSVDLVDEGAATNSLFSSQEELADAAHNLLNTPGIEQVLSSHKFPVLEEFYSKSGSTSLLDSLKSLLGLNKEESTLSNIQNTEDVDNTEILAQLKDAQTELAAVTKANQDLTTELATVKTANADLTTKLSDLETNLSARIEKLEKTPLAKHSLGNEEGGDSGEQKLRSYQDPKNPIKVKY